MPVRRIMHDVPTWHDVAGLLTVVTQPRETEGDR